MANDIFGGALQIPPDLMTKLDQMDKRLESIALSSENMAKQFDTSLSAMAKGFDPVVNSINTLNTSINNLDLSKLTGGFNDASQSIVTTTIKAEEMANAIVKGIQLLNGANKVSPIDLKSFDMAEDSLDEVNEKIKTYKRLLTDNRKGLIDETQIANSKALLSEIKRLQIAYGGLNTESKAYKQYEKAMGMSEASDVKRETKILALVNAQRELNKYAEKYSSELTVIDSKIANLKQLNINSAINIDSELEKFPKTINEIEVNIDRLRKAAKQIDLGSDLSDTSKLEEVNKRIQYLDSTLKNLKKTASQTTEVDLSKAYSMSENTINQRIAKIRELERVRKNLDDKDKNYAVTLSTLNTKMRDLRQANADAIKGSESLNKSHRKLMDTAGQLARRLALVFSISQIRNYINSMIEVRKNFELQQVSLQAIIQDKQEADKLFAQVTQLAVNSPYKIQELITYTKQMAAYRVETEKLYDTTKMLADVAAGVGIDMQRLILAYGQVKAANYLRGTELRQFSEAGINILGELAKKFSQVKGEIVSVGEVMNMISKRKVSFGDVENVFKTLTADGGIFYNMQEKQAETLYGTMANLRDSLDLMFNDIGKKQDSTLKKAVNLIKAMIENWRTIAPIMTGILSTYLLYKGASFAVLTYQKISNTLLLAQGKAIKYAEAGQIAFNKAVKASPLILILSTIISIGLAIWQATSLAKNLNKELEKVRLTGLEEADESVRKFEQLAKVVSDATSTYKEQQDALAELQRKYGDMLPTQTLTINGIRSLKGSYDEATASIYAYIDAKNKEERIEMVRSEYSTEITDAMTQVQDVLIKNFKLTKEEAKSVASEIRNAINAGDIKTYDDFNNKLAELVSGIKGTTVSSKEFATVSSQIGDRFSGMTSTVADANEEFKNLYITINKQKNAIDEVINSEGAYRDAIRKRYDTQKDTTDKAIAQAKEYMNTISGLSGKETLTPIEQSQLNDAKAKLTAYYESIDVEAKDSKEYIENLSRGTVFVSQEAIRVAEISYKHLADTIKGESESISKTKFLGDLQQQVDKLTGTSTTKQINDFILQFAKTNNLDLKGFEDILIGADETFDEYTTRFKEKAKELQETINQQSTGEGFLLYDPKYLENLKKILPMFEELSKKLAAPLEGVKGTDKDPMEDIWKNRIKAIEDANKKYKELKKTMSDVEATTQTKELFRDVFKDANLDMDTYLNFDDNATMQSLEKLLPQLQKKFPKIATDLKRSLAEIKVDLVVDAKTESLDKAIKEIEDRFSAFNLGLDIKTMGFDKNIISDMMKSLGATDTEISLINIDESSFDDFIKYQRDKINELRKDDSERAKEEADKLQKQLTEIELNEAKKRLNELASLREKYDTKDKKIETIKADILQWQKELGEETNAQQKELLELRIKNGEDAILQLESDALQLTDFWTSLFGDLEYVGINSLQKLIDKSKEITKNAVVIKDESGKPKGYTSSYTDKGITKEVTLTVQQYQQLLKKSTELSNKIAEENPFKALFDSIKEGKQQGEEGLDYINRLNSYMNDAIDTAKELATNLGTIFGADEEAQQTTSDIMNLVGGAVDLGVGAAKIASGDIVGGAVQAVKGIANIVSSIASLSDRKKEKQIKREKENVERLQKAYEKLKEAIDNAYSIDTLKESNKQAQENIDAQIASYENMIASEKEKKKTNWDDIEKYQEAIEDLKEQQEELKKAMYETAGGWVENVQDAASSFVDAWYDAFKETGNGLSGLEDKFKETILNIIKQQASLILVAPYVQKWKDELGKYFNEKDLEIETEEAVKWAETVKKDMPELAAALESFFKSLGSVVDTTSGELSGLQKGIQGVTETTAEALEALLNSMRFFVSDSNLQLKNIYKILSSNDETTNPMLAELRAQTIQVTAINRLLNSVVKGGNGGSRLKVEIL